jgi:DNA repair protein RecO (recombination protein O)
VVSAALARRTLRTRALLLRRVAYRDSDLIVSLFTETVGKVSALARGARKSRRRFGGTLEPFYTLYVQLDEMETRELLGLREASIDVARRHLTADLQRLEAAGQALGWVRKAAPPRTAEPEVWCVLSQLLDRLDDPDDASLPALHLAHCGLRLLVAFGWGIDFERCVVTGKICQPHRAAMVDPARGGLVSRSSGGGPIRLAAATRERLARAARGPGPVLQQADVKVALELVDAVLKAQAD